MTDNLQRLGPSLRERRRQAGIPQQSADGGDQGEDVKEYLNAQERADQYRNIAGYLNWVTTGLIGLTLLLAAGAMGVIPIGFSLPLGLTTGVATAIAGTASFVSLFTNIAVSKTATSIAERANVLYSDIDSKNQARRMVEAFEKTNSNDLPFARRDGKSWVAAVSSRGERSDTWTDRVTEQPDNAANIVR